LIANLNWGIQLSQVSDLIHEQLVGQEIENLSNGYRYSLSEGHTDLVITPAQVEDNEWGLCEIITITTVFNEGSYELTEAQVAHLNRRSAFGSFYIRDGNLECKQSLSIYEEEPAYRWYTHIILAALGSQLPFAIGQIQSEISDEHLRANRANLEYPRQWESFPASAPFDQAVEQFKQMGLVSTRSSHGLVLEMPLSEVSAASRMIDPQAETALLHVSIDTPHPLAGVGYLSTIAVPIDPAIDEIIEIAHRLNSLEHEQLDFVPRLGAWATRGLGDQLVYSNFWATPRGDDSMHTTMMNWMVQRTFWLRENFWDPGVGVQIEGISQ
jgi:hypothetical protein